MIPAPRLDADLGDALASGSLAPRVTDLATFEQTFVAYVEASAEDPEQAWDRFYDATLLRVGRGWGRRQPGLGTVATFTRIWSSAAALSRGPSALDLGTCFGFFPLAWAALPGAPRLVGADLSVACAALAARQSRRLRTAVDFVCADGRRLPMQDRAVSTVHMIHVLEHLGPIEADHMLDEALRVADRRVVVAVPIEARPDPIFGHLQTFDIPRLAVLGRRTGWHVSLTNADGAWLVLDRT